MKGLFAWVGFKQVGVPFVRPPRVQGKTAWNYWKLINFAIDGVTGFSTVPLRVWSFVGAFVSLIAFSYATFLIIRTLILGIDVPGSIRTLTSPRFTAATARSGMADDLVELIRRLVDLRLKAIGK